MNKEGEVLPCIRHGSADYYQNVKNRSDGMSFIRRNGAVDGFVDQYGKFLTRREAWVLAEQNGQLRYPSEGIYLNTDAPGLCSECLY